MSYDSRDRFFDYAKSLELLKKITGAVESDLYLKDLFMWRGYNLWQMYSQNIMVDIRNWTATHSLSEIDQTHTPLNLLKASITGLFEVLITIITWLYILIAQKRILVFGSDKISGEHQNDFRMDPLYGALLKGSAPYIEIIHAIPGMEMVKNLLKRNRPVMYLESFDWLTFFQAGNIRREVKMKMQNYSFTNMSRDEKELSKSIIAKYAGVTRISYLRVRIFSKLLLLSGLKTLFAIDDTRHYGEIMISAKIAGMNSYAIQHGHFTKYHVGWLKIMNSLSFAIPDKLVVWSEYWKDELIWLGTLFSPENIIIGGENRRYELVPKSKHLDINILIPYEIDVPKVIATDVMESLLSTNGVHIFLKLRRDISENEQFERYGVINHRATITILTHIDESLPIIDVAIGTYSTFLYEMVLRGIPVGVIKSDFDFGEGMVRNKLAESVGIPSLKKDIEKLAKTSDALIHSRKKHLMGASLMEETIGRIIKDLP
jgi:hypothetical protein